jgi:hypothetical protein
VYQVLEKPEVYKTKTMKDIRYEIPDYIKKNADIIGFENYNDLNKFDLGMKFLAYVVYFLLSVITRRQLIIQYEYTKEFEIQENKFKDNMNILSIL